MKNPDPFSASTSVPFLYSKAFLFDNYLLLVAFAMKAVSEAFKSSSGSKFAIISYIVSMVS